MHPGRAVARFVAASVVVGLLCACGGGHTAASLTPSVAPTTAAAGAKRAPMQLKMHIPARSATQAGRKPAFVSPSAAGLAITVSPALSNGSGAVTTAYDISTDGGSTCTINSDGSRDCTIALTAPVGADVFTVTVYDEVPSGGTIPVGANVLGQTTTQETVVANTTNAISFTLGGQVATLEITPSQIGFTSGTAGSTTAYVTALDAQNNIITGTDPYANPITVQSSGPMFSLQVGGGSPGLSVTLSSPAQSTVTVNYSGASFSTTYQLQASANGTTGAVSNIVNGTSSGSGTVTVPATTSSSLVAIDNLGGGVSTQAALLGIPANALTSTVYMQSQTLSVPQFGPVAIDSSGSGTLYAIVPGFQGIAVFHVSATNPNVVSYAGNLAGSYTDIYVPAALAVDPSGNLYVADEGSGSGPTIEIFAPAPQGGDLHPKAFIQASANSGPTSSDVTSIAADSSGNVFAYFYGYGVARWLVSDGYTSPFEMASSLSSFTNVAIAVEPDDSALYAVTDTTSSGPCALSHPTCSNIYGFQASAQTPAATFDIGLSNLNLNGIALTSSSVVVQSPYAGSTFLYKYSRSALKAAVQSSAGVVDESSGTQVAAANTSAALSGLAADSETSGGRAGIAYFASTAGIYADTASLGSSTQVLTQGGMSSPAAVAVDSAGDVYVADSTTNAIHMWQAFPADGLQPAFATLSGTAIGQPVSLATDSYNNLYVGNLAKDTVTVYKALTAPGAQNPAPFLTINLPSGTDPYQIALDAQNRLYVSDPDHSAVYIYNAGSTAIAQTLSVPELPTGIAVSPTGNVYVYVNYGGGYIFAYAPSGSALSTEPYQEIGTGLGASEGYLAIDANGTIYAQSPYQIRAFAQTGSALGPIGVTNVGFGTFAGLAVYAPKL